MRKLELQFLRCSSRLTQKSTLISERKSSWKAMFHILKIWNSLCEVAWVKSVSWSLLILVAYSCSKSPWWKCFKVLQVRIKANPTSVCCSVSGAWSLPTLAKASSLGAVLHASQEAVGVIPLPSPAPPLSGNYQQTEGAEGRTREPLCHIPRSGLGRAWLSLYGRHGAPSPHLQFPGWPKAGLGSLLLQLLAAVIKRLGWSGWGGGCPSAMQSHPGCWVETWVGGRLDLHNQGVPFLHPQFLEQPKARLGSFMLQLVDAVVKRLRWRVWGKGGCGGKRETSSVAPLARQWCTTGLGLLWGNRSQTPFPLALGCAAACQEGVVEERGLGFVFLKQSQPWSVSCFHVIPILKWVWVWRREYESGNVPFVVIVLVFFLITLG